MLWLGALGVRHHRIGYGPGQNKGQMCYPEGQLGLILINGRLVWEKHHCFVGKRQCRMVFQKLTVLQAPEDQPRLELVGQDLL